jgi:hypothetical protein
MKRTVFILCTLFLGIAAYSQNFTVSGKIVDKTNAPIEFAEVFLAKNDTIKASKMSDEWGNFSISSSQDNYTLYIRQLGDTLFFQNISLNQNVDLKTITIENQAKALSEVTIVGQKKLIERKVDRLVFNVENSIAATGSDALGALKVTPGIRVQNEQIAMIGKSTMSVMINERILPLSGSDLVNYLKSIPSDNILRIEVITTPPAKYDAEGNSGIVNIVLKKAWKNSFNGNIRTALSQSKATSGSLGVSLNYQKDRLTVSSSLNYTDINSRPFQEYSIYYPQFLWYEKSNRQNHSNNYSGLFAVDYQLTSNVIVGAEYAHSENKPMNIIDNKTSIYNKNNTIDSIIDNHSTIKIDRVFNVANFHTIFNIDPEGKKIKFDVDYVDNKTFTDNIFFSNSYFTNNELKPNSYFSANNNSNVKVNIYTSVIDFVIPSKWVNINFGAKVSFIKNNSNVEFYNTSSGNTVLDETRTNEFIYTENMQAVYISGTKNITSKFSIQLGLRGENVQTYGKSLTMNEINKNHFFKIYPTTYLNYDLNENNTISANYSRRVNRLSYNNLNPFRFYSTPFNYFEGNPFLQPYYTDNFEISHNTKNLYSSLFFSLTSNKYDQVTYVDSSSVIQIVKPNNFFKQISYGLFEGYSFSIKNILESSNDFSVFYQKTISEAPNVIPDISAWSGSFATNNSISFDKDRKFRAEINFMYQLPLLAGSYKLSSYCQLDFGFRTNLINKKLQISFNFADVLKTNKLTFKQTVNGIQQKNYEYNDTRNIRLSIAYRLGKDLKIPTRKDTNQEEKSRL